MCSIISQVLSPEEQKTALGACLHPLGRGESSQRKLFRKLEEMKMKYWAYKTIMSGQAQIIGYCDEYFDLWVDGRPYRVKIL